MKTQISRMSLQPGKRYSGVYQQQGRMITDADLNEAMDLVKARLDDALKDAIGSGATHAVVDAAGLLVPGPLYVDGVRAVLAALNGASAPFAMNQQADFPLAPAAAAACKLYADVWERTVTSLEDRNLRDPGLHGADTCTRTQAMAQVKWCDPAKDPLDPAHNPPRGNATLTLSVGTATAGVDPCDPSALAVALDRPTGNYLFRVEVHEVVGDPTTPTAGIVIKWSSENGAEQHLVDAAAGYPPAGFQNQSWSYEFYSDTSEKHLGVHLATGFQPKRGLLKDNAATPSNADLVNLNIVAPADRLYVRRWDGYCRLQRAGVAWSLNPGPNPGRDKGVDLKDTGNTDTARAVDFTTAGRVKIRLDALLLDLELAGRAFVAGDYWLATVRQDALYDAASNIDERVQPRSQTPTGVVHHYLVLGAKAGGAMQPLSDAEARRYSLPPLSNLAAANVGYTIPACGPAPTLKDRLATIAGWPDLDADRRTTLKDMMDALLCRLDADKIPNVAGVAGTVKDEIEARVRKAGDTMTGPLTIQSGLSVTGNTSLGGNLTLAGSVQGPLTVNGNLTVNGTAAMTAFRLPTTPAQGLVLTSDATGNGTWQLPVARGWDLANGGKWVVTAAGVGRVGINTATPEGDLHLGGSLPSMFLTGNTTNNADGLRLHYNANLRTGVLDVRGASLQLRGESTGNAAGATARLCIDLANGRVGIGTTTPATTLEVKGSISSPMWRVHQVIARDGSLPLTGQFDSGGGTLLIFASGSGYRAAAAGAGPIGMLIQLDGGSIATAVGYSNETLSHKAFVANAHVQRNYPAGLHTLTLFPNGGTSIDINDHFRVTVLELPF